MKLNEWIVGQVNGVDVKYMVKRKRESRLMKFISYLLFWQRDIFMEHYYTTIGRVMYVPHAFPQETTLEHELIHVYDYQRNRPWFIFSYLFLFPMVWTMRAHWEKRAYAWQLMRIECFSEESTASKEWLKQQFCTPAYLWMWPFSKAVEKWVDQVKSGEYAPIKSVRLVKDEA